MSKEEKIISKFKIKPQSACKRFKGKKLGEKEYWSPNLFTSKKIETMDMETGEPLSKKIIYKMWKLIMEESHLEDSLNDYTYYCLRHTFATYRLQYGKIDIRTLAKVMGCSVKYIEQHYDSARVENMTDYITRGVNEKSKDAFGDVILI